MPILCPRANPGAAQGAVRPSSLGESIAEREDRLRELTDSTALSRAVDDAARLALVLLDAL